MLDQYTIINVENQLTRWYQEQNFKRQNDSFYTESRLKQYKAEDDREFNKKITTLNWFDNLIKNLATNTDEDKVFAENLHQIWQSALKKYYKTIDKAIDKSQYGSLIDTKYKKYFISNNVFQTLLKLNDQIKQLQKHYANLESYQPFIQSLYQLRNNFVKEIVKDVADNFRVNPTRHYCELANHTNNMLMVFNKNLNDPKSQQAANLKAVNTYKDKCANYSAAKNFGKAVSAVVLSSIALVVSAGVSALIFPMAFLEGACLDKSHGYSAIGSTIAYGAKFGFSQMGIKNLSTFARYLTFQPTATEKNFTDVANNASNIAKVIKRP